MADRAGNDWTPDLRERLGRLGFDGPVARSIVEGRTADDYRAFLSNPYVVVGWTPKPFAEIDAAILREGVEPDDIRRTAAAMRVCLDNHTREGHTWASHEEIGRQMRGLRGLTQPLDVTSVKDVIAPSIQQVPGGVALKKVYDAEKHVAETLIQLTRQTSLPAANNRLDPRLVPAQREAVETMIRSGVSVLTGPPGCGKTFTISAAIAAAGRNSTQLCAPTGKAAKRMTEVTGQPATTIHSLINSLENADRDFSTLVVDEVSMLDVRLFSKLIDGLKISATKPFRLLLVGDADQLPSIGPGAILQNLVENKVVPVVALTKIMRQAEGSATIRNANNIRQSLPLEPPARKSDGDFFQSLDWPLATQKDKLMEAMLENLPSTRLKNGQPVNPLRDVLILSPVKKGLTGCDNLNLLMQEALNPPALHKAEAKIGGKYGFLLREGDKVIVTKNDYQLGVVNGDIGFATKVERTAVTVDLDGRLVTLGERELDTLKLAYAITVHKAQGTEAPVVVCVFNQETNPVMRQQNLLYTAVTRGKEKVWLLGDRAVVNECIRNSRPKTRKTLLTAMMRGAAEKIASREDALLPSPPTEVRHSTPVPERNGVSLV